MIETLTLLKREAETTHGEKAKQDVFRARAYDKAATQIRLFGRQNGRDISSEADVRSLHGMGAKMVAKLIEMLHTGKLRQAEEARANGRSEAVAELMGVWGAGRAHCNRWFDEGVRSLADLRRRTSEGSLKLTDNQMVGMRHYEDLGERIPRQEVHCTLYSLYYTSYSLYTTHCTHCTHCTHYTTCTTGSDHRADCAGGRPTDSPRVNGTGGRIVQAGGGDVR
jgi:DNA polymerase/3'-5' exonuclease PolX